MSSSKNIHNILEYIHQQCNEGNLEAIKSILLEDKSKINIAFVCSCSFNNLEMVKYLVEQIIIFEQIKHYDVH